MKDLQLINTLCESRIFRSKHDLGKFNDRQKRDLYYSVLLATIALALDTKTTHWARQYASAASAFSNFDFFRVSANDLYVLTYILQNELNAISKPQKQQILRLYRGIGKGNIDKSFVQQFLLRMERSLSITDTKLRNVRRTLNNWGDSSPVARKTAITQLHRFIRTRAKLAEVLPYLITLTKGEAGHYGKDSALKTIAKIAGAGLAGLALGLRHDPNKRYSVFNSVEVDETPLNEDRATQLFHLVQDMRKHPEVEKIISVNYIADGISAFVRTTDGNAYEMEIRPAPFAKGHEEKRGINEGWEWHVLGESFDMTDETCTRCGAGQYVETGIQDDMQGVLHCNNKECRMQIDRHAEAGDQVETD
ncbi:MAG: hypothetical protein ACTSPB_16580 [Candidatus Thorarchaeota archaeon]